MCLAFVHFRLNLEFIFIIIILYIAHKRFRISFWPQMPSSTLISHYVYREHKYYNTLAGLS